MRLAPATAIALTSLTLAVPARADLPSPMDYAITEAPAGRVEVFLASHYQRRCPDQGLLRRNVDTGEVVKITSCDGDSFLDECVPAGTYQYGLAEPYECTRWGSFYYRAVTIAGAAEGCVRTVAAPAAADGVPWRSSPWVCRSEDERGGCAAAGDAVLGTNLALLLAGLALWRWRGARRPRA